LKLFKNQFLRGRIYFPTWSLHNKTESLLVVGISCAKKIKIHIDDLITDFVFHAKGDLQHKLIEDSFATDLEEVPPTAVGGY